MHNRMLARVPKGPRPKQVMVARSRCPHTGQLMEPGEAVHCQEIRSDVHGVTWFRIYWALPALN